MLIRKILIELAIEEKVFKKHGIKRTELEGIFLSNGLKCLKTREKRYLAIGFANRFITVVFEYCKGAATIVTAYPSSEWQIRLYKRK